MNDRLSDSLVSPKDVLGEAGAPAFDESDHETIAVTPEMVSAAIEFLCDNAVHVYSDRLVSYKFVYALLVEALAASRPS